MMEGMAEMIAAPNELLSRGRMKPCTGVVDAKSATLSLKGLRVHIFSAPVCVVSQRSKCVFRSEFLNVFVPTQQTTWLNWIFVLIPDGAQVFYFHLKAYMRLRYT